ncbi:MAG: hypothetical protein R2747_03540 [Pyrinomonadaceae bacterium]
MKIKDANTRSVELTYRTDFEKQTFYEIFLLVSDDKEAKINTFSLVPEENYQKPNRDKKGG